MCGIFGYIGKKNDAADIVFEGLKRLEYRGYDSWGIAVASRKLKVKSKRLLVEKHVGKIGESKLDFQLSTFNSKIALGHTRWATHGGVTESNAHPHLDCTNNFAVVHNGIIENFQGLKNELTKKGHVFRSDTDTEVFPHLVEEYRSLSFVESVKKAFGRLSGRNAFAVISAKDKALVGIRDGSPLVFGIGDKEYFLASDVPAFLQFTKKVIFLDDRQGVFVKENNYQVFDLATKKFIEPKIEKISWSRQQTEKGKYAHFLLKEILEQGSTIRASSKQSDKEIGELAEMIKKAFGSYLVACGTASYAALFGTYVFSVIAKKHINWAIGSEFSSYQHFLTPKSLVIAVSQSGETADTLEAIHTAKQKGARTVGIVNVVGSSLARAADSCLLTNAGPEIAVVSTKAFTAQLAVLLLLAYATAGKLKTGKLLIEKAAEAISGWLNEANLKKIQDLARKLKSSKHVYIIGKGQNYPIALEAALKIKEASYLHGEGFAAGELKHGVITLIEKNTPCIVLFGNDQEKNYILGAASEMKARGGFIIGIGPADNEVFDQFIEVPDIPEGSAIINTPPVQLLAYFLAVENGLDPDKPRNLAKSVTVR